MRLALNNGHWLCSYVCLDVNKCMTFSRVGAESMRKFSHFK